MNNPDKCPKCGSGLSYPIKDRHANYECNSFMTSNGKFGQDVTCLRLEKITAPMLARLEKFEAALECIRDCDWVITLPDRMDAVRQIAREALQTPS